MKFLLNKALLARTYLLLHKVLFTNLLWCSRFSSCFDFSRLISIYHYISQVSRQYNISQKSFGALWLIWKICFKFQKLGMRERFCSLFKCYSLYCFGLLYKNRKKQIAVLQKNDLPITIHFSPPNVCTQNTWFSVHLEHSAEMLGGLWYISLAQFFGKKVLNFVYTSVWRTKYLLPQFSIFLVQEISLHFHFFEDVYTTFGGYFSCSGEPKSDSSRTRVRPEVSVHHYFLGSSFLSRDRRSSSNNHFYF